MRKQSINDAYKKWLEYAEGFLLINGLIVLANYLKDNNTEIEHANSFYLITLLIILGSTLIFNLSLIYDINSLIVKKSKLRPLITIIICMIVGASVFCYTGLQLNILDV